MPTPDPIALPELPEPAGRISRPSAENSHNRSEPYFTVRQMRAYGQACVDAAHPIPADMVLVPREATPEMYQAARSVPEPVKPYSPHFSLIWDAMLSAAPSTPPLNEPFGNSEQLASLEQRALELGRFGRAPAGSPYLLVPMDDGYWTPWHVAQQALDAAALSAQPRGNERKPSWESAPAWANWLTMDANGAWCWWSDKPLIGTTEWEPLRGSLFELVVPAIEEFLELDGWRDTFEKRPVLVGPGFIVAGYRYRACPSHLRHTPWDLRGTVTEYGQPMPGPSDTIQYQTVYLKVNQAEDAAPQPREVVDVFSADYVLPCDVLVRPATTITKGCTLRTLMQSIQLREGADPFPNADYQALSELLNPQPREDVTCKGPCTPNDFFNGKACDNCIANRYSPPWREVQSDTSWHECPHCKGWSRATTPQDAAGVEGSKVYLMQSDFGLWKEQTKAEHEWWDGKQSAPLRRVLYTTPPPGVDVGKLRDLVDDLAGESREEWGKSQDYQWAEWVRDRHNGKSTGLADAAGRLKKLLDGIDAAALGAGNG